MTGFFDSDIVERKAKIGIVRALLNVDGCLDHNPFMYETDADSLSSLFKRLADGATFAAENLSKITKVPVIESGNVDEEIERLASMHAGETCDLDVVLAPAFIEVVKTPCLTLQELEREELDEKPRSAEKVEVAMNGLVQVVIFAKAVSEIYGRSINNAPVLAT